MPTSCSLSHVGSTPESQKFELTSLRRNCSDARHALTAWCLTLFPVFNIEHPPVEELVDSLAGFSEAQPPLGLAARSRGKPLSLDRGPLVMWRWGHEADPGHRHCPAHSVQAELADPDDGTWGALEEVLLEAGFCYRTSAVISKLPTNAAAPTYESQSLGMLT